MAGGDHERDAHCILTNEPLGQLSVVIRDKDDALWCRGAVGVQRGTGKGSPSWDHFVDHTSGDTR